MPSMRFEMADLVFDVIYPIPPYAIRGSEFDWLANVQFCEYDRFVASHFVAFRFDRSRKSVHLVLASNALSPASSTTSVRSVDRVVFQVDQRVESGRIGRQIGWV